MAKKKGVAKEFAKLAKEIQEMARKQGLYAFSNRLKLFIHGKPARRWWVVDTKKDVLISVEYGMVDEEVVAFLKQGLKG